MSGPGALLLSIAMIASFLLAIGGIALIARGTDRKKGVLMALAALVLAGNVLVWTWPL